MIIFYLFKHIRIINSPQYVFIKCHTTKTNKVTYLKTLIQTVSKEFIFLYNLVNQ